MRCTICDHENPDYAVVCEQCGSFLPKMSIEPEQAPEDLDSILDPVGSKEVRCSYCWHVNPAEAELCEVCGMPLLYVPYPENDGKYADVPLRGKPRPRAIPIPEGMVRCRKCWRDNPEDATQCEFCGNLLKQGEEADYEYIRKLRDTMITCVECGTVVPWSAITCPFCGANPRVGYETRKNDISDSVDAIKLMGETASIIAKSARLEMQERYRRKREEELKIKRSKNRGKINHIVPGTKRCRYCWYDNPMTAEICEQCGMSLPGARMNKVEPKGTSGRRPEPDVPKVEKRKKCTCGYVNLPYVTVCLKCGGEVNPRCPNCGAENPKGAVYCSTCFTRLSKTAKK